MAPKKFSRLSIMLEARDRMSSPMLRAAKASQNLQSRVTQLSGSLNKSRSSVVNASVANRVLGERYRELGNRISQTDEKVKASTRLFRALPAPMRLAAYTAEGYAKALYNIATQNVVARTSTKLLTTTFKGLYTVTWNLNYYMGRMAKTLWSLSGASKVVKLLATPLKFAAQNAKLLAQNILLAGKATFAYKMTSAVVKAVARDIKSAAQSQLMFIKDIPRIVKGTQTWNAYAAAINRTKLNIGSMRLAFELWKNSSKGVEKIKHTFDGIANSVKKVLSPLKLLANNFRGLRSGMQQTGNTGRATFNQLANANARLNREITKMNRELSRANSRLSSMRGNLGSINAMGAAFTAMYTGQMVAHTGDTVVRGTIGKAMEQDYNKAGIGILAGPENGDAFFKQIQDYAATTAYSPEDWARSMRGAIGKSKTVEDLEKFQLATEQLATLDPVQGLEGAALAIRELNSGDSRSLVERFELPRKALDDIRKMEDPIKQLDKLMEVVGKETGFTIEAITQMKELPLMQWQKFTNTMGTLAGHIGSGALDILAPIIERANNAIAEGKFEGLINTLTNGMTKATQGVVDFATNIYNAFASGEIQQKYQPFIDLWGNIKSSISEAWPTIKSILDDARVVLGFVADEVNDKWPLVNTVLQGALGIVKDISSWIRDNWSVVVPIVIGLATAIGGFKIATAIAAGFTVLKNAMMLFRSGTLLATAAQWALNVAMRANPIGFIISLVIGLGVALYTAYQKNETFREAVQAALNWLKEKGVQALDLGKAAVDGLKNGFKSASEWVSDLWEKFKGFAKSVKENPLGTLMDGAKAVGNFITGGGPAKGAHGGLNYVPYDNYPVRLHKGEKVLTAQEAKQHRNGNSNGGVVVTGNTFIVRNDSDIDSIAEALLAKLTDAKNAMG